MKLDEKTNKELKQKTMKILEESTDKSQAISDVIEMFINNKYGDLISEIQSQAARADVDKDYASKLGLRPLSKKEEAFYEALKDPKQAITTKQIDAIPSSIIDLSLENIKKEEPVLKLINFTPADVKRWIITEKTGTYSWEGLTEKLKGELGANIKSLATDLGKLDTYLIIPKAISDLSYQFMDKYFMAIVDETLRGGLAFGYLIADGKEKPIGVYKKIDKTNEDGTHQDKEVNTDLTNFSPKGLASAKAYLSNNGKRVLDKIYLICNPEDEANYVAPAIYDKEGNVISSFKNFEVIPCTENPKGKAALTIAGKYVMGTSGYKITKYEETMALEDADVLIGKIYANGRAVADNVAYIFDVTKLEEYVPTIKTVASVVSLPETPTPASAGEQAAGV